MDIERGASNTFLVPARERETHYLLVFQNMDDPTNYQRVITTNTGPSSSPLMLTVVETNNATAVDGEVTLGLGDWQVSIYGQNSDTNLNPSASVREVHSELVRVHGDEAVTPEYPPDCSTGDSDPCPFDIIVRVGGVEQEVVPDVDPCVDNSVTINITAG
jgi:hypothetical protein